MNRITPEAITDRPCPAERDPARIAERYQEFLGDESRLRAPELKTLFLPTSPEQVAGAITELQAAGQTCVLSAGRTGITGGAVPLEADALVSLAGLKRFLALGRDEDGYYARLQPGVSLDELTAILQDKRFADLETATAAEAEAAAALDDDLRLWLPVDPTETTAHIGGVVANNASGARSFRYGSARHWVRALQVILADGRLLRIKRGQVMADGDTFALAHADGTERELRLPRLSLPQARKCTAGYHCRPGMDLVDLLVGSEGTLGAIVEIELKLVPRPESILGVLAVVADEQRALELVEGARNRDNLPLAAIEYFDHDALAMLKAKKDADGAGSAIPEIPSWDGAAIYLELHGSEEETEEACEALEELLTAAGSSLDDTWAALEPDELEHQKHFRHALPEAVNAYIGQQAGRVPGLHKVGTDMAVPDEQLRAVMTMYRQGLAAAGLRSVVFGHIGDNHAHVNILPENLRELQRAKDLYLEWAQEVVRMRGAVAAEHGIGRIKRSMLALQYPPSALAGMRKLRRTLDPQGLFAPGVMV